MAKLLIPAPVISRLDAYLASREDVSTVPALYADRPSRRRPLFATMTGKHMYRAEVAKILRRLAKAAGLPEELVLSPHSMRHTCATLSLDAGVELRGLQDAMGHADPPYDAPLRPQPQQSQQGTGQRPGGLPGSEPVGAPTLCRPVFINTSLHTGQRRVGVVLQRVGKNVSTRSPGTCHGAGLSRTCEFMLIKEAYHMMVGTTGPQTTCLR